MSGGRTTGRLRQLQNATLHLGSTCRQPTRCVRPWSGTQCGAADVDRMRCSCIAPVAAAGDAPQAWPKAAHPRRAPKADLVPRMKLRRATCRSSLRGVGGRLRRNDVLVRDAGTEAGPFALLNSHMTPAVTTAVGSSRHTPPGRDLLATQPRPRSRWPSVHRELQARPHACTPRRAFSDPTVVCTETTFSAGMPQPGGTHPRRCGAPSPGHHGG
jgi:hypothetical protein